jgi:hypothetical protein
MAHRVVDKARVRPRALVADRVVIDGRGQCPQHLGRFGPGHLVPLAEREAGLAGRGRDHLLQLPFRGSVRRGLVPVPVVRTERRVDALDRVDHVPFLLLTAVRVVIGVRDGVALRQLGRGEAQNGGRHDDVGIALSRLGGGLVVRQFGEQDRGPASEHG